jgi:hypothetical protein
LTWTVVGSRRIKSEWGPSCEGDCSLPAKAVGYHLIGGAPAPPDLSNPGLAPHAVPLQAGLFISRSALGHRGKPGQVTKLARRIISAAVRGITLSRGLLVEAYTAALPLAAVAIVSSADSKRCRIMTGGEPGPGEAIERRLYFKPSHAELVLTTISLDGWTDQQPAAVAALVERTATTLGAPFGELRRAAEEAVAEITARVDAMRQNGALKQVNAEYKRYRTQQKMWPRVGDRPSCLDRQ